MTSRSSTERLGDFSSESVGSHLVSWVSSWVVLVCFLVGFWFLVVFVCFALEDTWLFALTYSPTCGNSQSKTRCFDDRLSLERARHEPKKKEVCGLNSVHGQNFGAPFCKTHSLSLPRPAVDTF